MWDGYFIFGARLSPLPVYVGATGVVRCSLNRFEEEDEGGDERSTALGINRAKGNQIVRVHG